MATKAGTLTKVLAIVGTLLVWFPIVAMVVTGTVGSIQRHRLLVDYLIPAEVFPVVLVGAGLLLWAALRARARRRSIAVGLALMVAFLAGAQALAVVTGLASGATEPRGLPWLLVVALLAGYTLALIAVGIAGILLIRAVAPRHHTGEERL